MKKGQLFLIFCLWMLTLDLTASAQIFDQGQLKRGQQTITLERLWGKSVFSKDKKEIGKIHKILINRKNAEVDSVVISLGGFGRAFKLIPWKLIKLEQGRFVVQVDMERIDQAPFVNDQEAIDDIQVQESYEFFGVEYLKGSAQEEKFDQK